MIRIIVQLLMNNNWFISIFCHLHTFNIMRLYFNLFHCILSRIYIVRVNSFYLLLIFKITFLIVSFIWTNFFWNILLSMMLWSWRRFLFFISFELFFVKIFKFIKWCVSQVIDYLFSMSVKLPAITTYWYLRISNSTWYMFIRYWHKFINVLLVSGYY